MNDTNESRRRWFFKNKTTSSQQSTDRPDTPEDRRTHKRTSRSDDIIDGFSLTEKFIFLVFVVLFVGSAAVLFWQVNESYSTSQSVAGGSFTEGVIGSPRFINPLLAVSDADNDLVSLVYSGLLKRLPNNTLVYDLADSITVSNDATVFTVTLKEDAVFHDGTPVTARDVAFTVNKAQDPQLRSPIQGDWSGVNVSIIDEREVQFELDEPFTPFLENLTLGILPAHIWESNTATQFPSSPHNDATPIGSGPYKVSSFTRQPVTALSEYTLTAFDNYVHGKPYISNLTIRSFTDEEARLEALREGTIDSAGGIGSETASLLQKDGYDIRTAYLPRIFAVFFNHNQNSIFTDKVLRDALRKAIDKQQIVDSVLHGFGSPIEGPLPKGFHSAQSEGDWVSTSSVQEAKSLLTEAGYHFEDNVLFDGNNERVSFEISTADSPTLIESANILKDMWSKIGVEVTIKIFPTGDLNRDIIRQRNYEALLFGEVVGPAGDLFPFWHSSQQEDPGLNIAQYTNIDADSILEDMRETADPQEQKELYQQFIEIVKSENPALFLYTPAYIYSAPSHVKNLTIGPLNTASNRFSLIHQWYINTKQVWKPFEEETASRTLQPIQQTL